MSGLLLRRKINNRYKINDEHVFEFVNKTGITDQIQIETINSFVEIIKKNGLWQKFVAIYPIIGSNANAHKYNLVDVNKYSIQFIGQETHNNFGLTTGYSSPSFNLSTTNFLNNIADFHMSIYVGAGWASGGVNDIGYPNRTATNTQPCCSVYLQYSDNKLYFDCGKESDGRLFAANGDNRGFFFMNNKNNIQEVYKGDMLLGSRYNYNSNISVPFHLNGYVSSTGANNNQRRYQFITFGYGLTSLEHSILYNNIEVFQKKLKRQI